jgi:SAM-dependent methyltransferase
VDNRIESVLLTIAMYQPLYELNLPSDIWSSHEINWTRPLQPLIAQIHQYYEEMKIREDIDVIGNTGNKVSLAVRKQYEENPYPRWLPFNYYLEKTTFGRWLTDGRHLNFTPPDFLQKPIRLLIAGCGTGQEVFYANAQWHTSQVLAVDLSRSSLAYAIRTMRELGTGENIEYRQADILEMGGLSGQYSNFDVISCGGVLHHMENPMQGWRVLLGLLRPGGVMRIALYSELGRRYVAKARELIADKNIQPTPENIRQFRHDALSSKYPELNMLWRSNGMYSTSTCRDLLFHVQEHRFYLERIKEMINELNLRFIGFDLRGKSRQEYRQMFPNDPDMTNLDNWSLFEHKYPDTFTAMYNMILQKPGASTTPQ